MHKMKPFFISITRGWSIVLVAKYMLVLVCFFIGTGAIFYGFINLILATDSESISCEDRFVIEESSQNENNSCISWAILTIDINGAVKSPGIYRVNTNSRIADVIEKAGGLTKDADLDFIQNKLNLAQRVADGEKIIIPYEGYEIANEEASGDLKSSQLSEEALISINEASEQELLKLSGIGEVRAKKIIEGRPYTSISQLVEKKILTEKMMDEIKSTISL